MKKTHLGALVLLSASALQTANANRQETTPVVPIPNPVGGQTNTTPAAQTSRVVDLAICLDTSGSMSGLIDATRQKIWSIINDLALASPQPDLRVALLTFGNQGHSAENGWVEIQSGLTEDLDLISERLFALTTNGGEEYVGRVVDRATRDLAWSPEPGALKLIVVAGNESAFQDPTIKAEDAARRAIANDLMVNTIYCGPATDNIAPSWLAVSKLADGHFASIDHQNGTVAIATPFDAELASLSSLLNTTYLPFGQQGEAKWMNQRAQDSNALTTNSATAAGRAASKSSALYNCASWDLVDALRDGKVELAKLKVEELPEEMREQTLEQRIAHVKAKGEERKQLQAKLQAVDQKRQAFVQAELQKSAVDTSKSMDFALRTAIRAQATARGFRFPTEEAVVTPAAATTSEVPLPEPAASVRVDAPQTAAQRQGC